MRLWRFALLVPGIALATTADDYARQWSLVTDAGAGAYRVTLDADVYRAAQSPLLADVDIVDAAGNAVPASLFGAASPGAAQPARTRLPWFALPAGAMASAGSVSLDIERNADGSLRRIGTAVSEPQRIAEPGAWLLDASAVDGRIAALELAWSPVEGGLDARYRIDGSDDLRDWRVLQTNAALVDLSRDGERLQQRRIALDAQAKYLRLTRTGGRGPLSLTDVQAEVAGAADAPDWQWRELTGSASRVDRHAEFTFVLDGRFPVEVAEVALPGNSAAEWTLHSREDDTAPWRVRAGPWVSYRIGDAQAERSAPQVLSQRTRDRQWKLVARTSVQEAPILRLGWRPESVVFVAQGAAPYRLVAGSARTARADAPVPQLLVSIRDQRGRDWQPSPARLGEAGVLAGDAALQPAAQPMDWRRWLLWGVLLVGALLVAGFAASLLRQPAGRDR